MNLRGLRYSPLPAALPSGTATLNWFTGMVCGW